MGTFLPKPRLTFSTMSRPEKIVDSLLVIAYQGGDKKAMDMLVRRWNKKVCIHAYRYVRDWELAKDITQDTWNTILAKIHRLRDSHSFGSWAITIAGRKAIHAKKKKATFEKKVSSIFWENQPKEFQENTTKDEKISRILEVFKTLSLEHQIVLKLFYLEEYSLKEISQITETSINTVKTRLFRAREKIKEELKKPEK
ncbi:MAG: sigma-70 family RNA polymerase sigma factor [Bacteroidota bacterium]